MLPVVESIHVLKLRKNDKIELENQLNEKFPGTRINFLEVDGQTVNKNEGSIHLSFCQIVNQNYVDEVALDITRNHIEMIKQAYASEAKCVMFMEEDSRIENVSAKKCASVNNWLANSPKWDIFYLGYCNYPMPVSFLVTTNIVKLWNPLAAHCYILNKRGMEKILNYTEYGNKNMKIHVDKMYTKIPFLAKYGMFPMIAFQNKDPALFVKACDKLNLNLSMRTACKYNEYVSILLPILFIVLLGYFLMKLFF
jgi:hypothetical protein